MVLNLVALHGQPRVVAAVVAGDVIVFEPKNVEGQPKTQILVAVERQPAGLKRSALTMSVGFLIPGATSERM